MKKVFVCLAVVLLVGTTSYALGYKVGKNNVPEVSPCICPEKKTEIIIPEPKYEIDKVERECLVKAVSTADMIGCTYNAMDSWFVEIDKSTKSLKDVLSSEKYTVISNSQKQWKKYQEAEFDSINEIIFDKGGTMYHPIATSFKANIVKQRALELKAYCNTLVDKY